ncbi:MAG: helix-turn-helix domain-containing protein [Bifidobacteriaceae bacterium]|jgi:hypothetical protein|nr:helix-turn-helix domain-containing protein [Bifidobacteriaceae bacterium]
MRIEPRVIAEDLNRRGLGARVVGRGKHHGFAGVRLLTPGGAPEAGYLYLCPPRDPPSSDELPAGPGYAVVEPAPALPAGRHIVLEAEADPLAALAVIGSTFDRYSAWERELLSLAASDTGLEAITQVGESMLGNPVFALDPLLRPLAGGERMVRALRDMAPPPFYRSEAGQWMTSDAFLRQLDGQGLMAALQHNSGPVIFKGAPMEFIAARLILNGRTAGFIAIPPLSTRLEAHHLAETEVLARALTLAIERRFLRQASELTPAAIPAIQVLESEDEADLMQLVRPGWRRHDQYAIIAIRSLRNLDELTGRRELFRKLFVGCEVVLGRTLLVVILRDHGTARLRRELDSLSVVFEANGLVAGVSLDFNDLTEARSFYRQALICADSSRLRADGPIRFYADHLGDHLAEVFAQRFPPDRHMLPSVRALAAYDSDHGGALVETLFVYLTHDRSHDACAERLRIHKSTLKYRLSRVRDLVGDDCFSPDQRLGVLNSIQLARSARATATASQPEPKTVAA